MRRRARRAVGAGGGLWGGGRGGAGRRGDGAGRHPARGRARGAAGRARCAAERNARDASGRPLDGARRRDRAAGGQDPIAGGVGWSTSSSPEAGSAADDLLRTGLARVRPEFETRGCEAERLARRPRRAPAGLGLWNEPDSLLDAEDIQDLRAADGRFVIVEGAVRRVGVSRSRVYLDLGRRDGFTVVVARKAEPAFQRRGLVLKGLAGQPIRVRGVMEDRFGPRIELVDPLMIERIEGAGGSKPGG